MVEVEITSPIIEMLNQYGFATVAAIAMGWFIYFIYNYVTGQIIEKFLAPGRSIDLLNKNQEKRLTIQLQKFKIERDPQNIPAGI